MACASLRDLGALMPTKALIPLPSASAPVGTKCHQFAIPDDSEWKGMFWGALDQLTRWNSYERDPGHTALAVASAWKDIVATAREGCPPPDCPGSYPYIDTIPGVTQGYDEYQSWLSVNDCIANCDSGGDPSIWFGQFAYRNLSFRNEASITFRDLAYNLVGQKICNLYVNKCAQTPLLVDWHIKWLDCVGFIHDEAFNYTTNPEGFARINITAQWVWIDANIPFSLCMTLVGPIQCGPA